MKKQFFTILLILVCITAFTSAQPQWKFHVAFEDATGAKDTIWFIWDTTAVFYGIDTALGEGNPNMDYSKFNVWTLTWGVYPDYDTTKVVAHPYNYSFGSEIKAINFELPIIISWDSAMLHAGWLPPEPVGWVNFARIQNNFFFFYNNMDFDHQFDMTLAHKITAPGPGNTDPWAWEKWVHFPMEIYLVQDPTVSIYYKNDSGIKTLTAFPNPFAGSTHFEFYLNEPSYVEISVYSLQGKLVKSLTNKKMKACPPQGGTNSGRRGGKHQIKWGGLNNAGQACKPGPYIAYLKVNGKTKKCIKLIKTQ